MRFESCQGSFEIGRGIDQGRNLVDGEARRVQKRTPRIELSGCLDPTAASSAIVEISENRMAQMRQAGPDLM